MAAEHGSWKTIEAAVEKSAVHGSVGAMKLARTICIEQPDNNSLCTILKDRIVRPHFVNPLGHCVVVELFYFVLVHDGFSHDLWPVSVNLRSREVDNAKTI